jgi:HPt (histidine-containing phosphotransfer) domain-containing protein
VASETAITLDRERLREITLDDPEAMREILAALIDDMTRQVGLLDAAIRGGDARECARLAHYSKGACANAGACAAAACLRSIEARAGEGRFGDCRRSLKNLSREVSRLRSEAGC